MRKQQADELMRLADALCGFARAAWEGRSELKLILDQAKENGYIQEV